MTNVLLHDSRSLVLPPDTIVDALIEFDRAHKRWPEHARPESARLDPGEVGISVRQAGQDAPTERTYSLATIAAAIIHYCAKMRVPVPKSASKSVNVTPDGVTMVLSGTLILQKQNDGLPDRGATSSPAAAKAAHGDPRGKEAATPQSPSGEQQTAAAPVPAAEGKAGENDAT